MGLEGASSPPSMPNPSLSSSTATSLHAHGVDGHTHLDGAAVVPAKRKAQDEATHVDKNNKASTSQASAAGSSSGAHQAHRAYIAHTAPHLLEASPGSSPAQSSYESGSSPRSLNGPLTLPSPSPSEEDRDRDRSASRSASSPANPGHAHVHVGETSRQRSHHSVPKRYRGPLPWLGDAEDIAPAPNLVPAGSGGGGGGGSSSSSSSTGDLFNVLNFPFNRNGWRYAAAGPASHSLPQTVYRTLESEPYGVHWSWGDRSTFTLLSQDATIVSATNGFRSARANVPVREGSWYVEIHILQPDSPASNAKDGNHVRVGWARREAPLNAPVGFNGYSYGMRDATGEKVFLSRTYPYGRDFAPGDVVGMWISLPAARKADHSDPLDPAHIERKRLPIRYKGRLYFEQLEYAVPKEMDHLMDRSRRGEKLVGLRGPPHSEMAVNVNTGFLAPPTKNGAVGNNGQKKRKGPAPPPGSAPGKDSTASLRTLPTLGPESQIGFFVNGEPQGIAFDNLLDFRPLRRQKIGPAQKKAVKSKPKPSSALSADGAGGDGGGEVEENIITAHSTAASILKSRENYFDDGALGYFPFVSLYGRAKARIVTSLDEFRFPPPSDIRASLEQADRNKGRLPLLDGPPVGPKHWRAIADRYIEFLDELWQHDLADEVKAQIAAQKAAEEQSSEEDNEEDEDDGRWTSAATAQRSSSSKRPRKKALSSSMRRTGSSTPAHDSAQASASPQPVKNEKVGGLEGAGTAVKLEERDSRHDSPATTDATTPMDWDAPPPTHPPHHEHISRPTSSLAQHDSPRSCFSLHPGQIGSNAMETDDLA